MTGAPRRRWRTFVESLCWRGAWTASFSRYGNRLQTLEAFPVRKTPSERAPRARAIEQEDGPRSAVVRRHLVGRLCHRSDPDRASGTRDGGGTPLRAADLRRDCRFAGAGRTVLPPDHLRLS